MATKKQDYQLVNANKMAEMLGVSMSTFYRHIDSGMPVCKIGSMMRFYPCDVLAWAKNAGGHCSYCDKKFERFSHVRKKYCSEKCYENAKNERQNFRRNWGLTIDRETTEPEPAETVNIRGYDLAPEHAKRMEELIRKKAAAGWTTDLRVDRRKRESVL